MITLFVHPSTGMQGIATTQHVSVCRKAYTPSSSSSLTFCRYAPSYDRHAALLDAFCTILCFSSTVLGGPMCWESEDAGGQKLHASGVLMQNVTNSNHLLLICRCRQERRVLGMTSCLWCMSLKARRRRRRNGTMAMQSLPTCTQLCSPTSMMCMTWRYGTLRDIQSYITSCSAARV